MLLESMFGATEQRLADPEDLEQLRKDFKGFELAHRILQQPGFHRDCKALYVALQTSWTWYTNQVETIQSPMDGFKQRILQCGNNWWEDELVTHFKYCFGLEVLEWIGYKQGEGGTDFDRQDKDFGGYAVLVLNIAAERSWAKLLLKLPPFCYAAVASSDRVMAQATVDRMKHDFETMQWLETFALIDPFARALKNDIIVFVKKAIRLLFLLFERDNWSVDSVQGQRYIRALLIIPPTTSSLRSQ